MKEYLVIHIETGTTHNYRVWYIDEHGNVEFNHVAVSEIPDYMEDISYTKHSIYLNKRLKKTKANAVLDGFNLTDSRNNYDHGTYNIDILYDDNDEVIFLFNNCPYSGKKYEKVTSIDYTYNNIEVLKDIFND